MNIVRFAIANPVKVTVVVVLLVLFGAISVFRIPIQLTPNVDKPRISINTRWQGASPDEIEEEIIQRQEEKLKGVNNLKKMTSTSRQGVGEVVLEFHVGADKDEAFRDTIERINQVSNYPIEVERPRVVASDSSLESPIAWLIFHGPEDLDASTYRDYVEDHVKPILERVKGVATVDVYGGQERELQVRLDPYKLAARGLTFRDVADALRRQNRNISAGTITQGKRDTVFRTIGQYESPEQVLETVVAYRQGGPVYVRDVVRDPAPDGSRAGVELSYKERTSFVRNKGRYVLALPVRREPGSNVISVMRELKEKIRYVNRYVLEPRNEGLHLEQVYDETVYVVSAIKLVRNNLFFGGFMSIVVLLVFLRSASATAVVALCIPISVVGTFLFVAILKRPLNVVMLAGIAFAVGMIVDSAIVLLENIFRHRQLGKQRVSAAIDGTEEVWGAVLASTLTTVVVFLPVMFVEEEAGQLFRDIAIAIVVAVTLSLGVAVIVIPTLGARMLGKGAAARHGKSPDGRLAIRVAGLVDTINRRPRNKWAVITVLALVSILGSIQLMPPSSYLPTGNRNLVFGFVSTPPGYSLEEFRQIAAVVEEGDPADPYDGLRYAWEAELGSKEEARLPLVRVKIGNKLEHDPSKVQYTTVRPAPIANFFFVSFNNSCFMGATSKDSLRVRPAIGQLEAAASRVPGAYAHVQQTSLFGSISESDDSIDLEVRGDDIQEVRRTASILMPALMQRFGGYPRPEPANFDLGRPEVRAVPNRTKAADLGLSVEELGFVIQACVDGAYVGEYSEGGDKIDLTLVVDGTENAMTRELAAIPIYTPSGHVVPLASVVDFVNTTAPQQINHIEEQPSVKFTVKVPESMALQAAMEVLENEIIRPLREKGAISPRVITVLAGNADKLVQTRQALFGKWTGLNFSSIGNLIQSRGFLALLVMFLLMAALFESYVYPLVILFSVPLATLGGFMGLAVLHAWTMNNPVVPTQQLDTLTMMGFIMLVGIVVNNAILLVHQTLNYINQHRLAPDRAIVAAVRTRVRPILMTAMTTIFGQLPLVIMPGAGSELYRGIGSVMLGGLLVSTVFTLILVPAVLSVSFDAKAWMRSLRRRDARASTGGPPVAAEPAVAKPALDDTVTLGAEPLPSRGSGA